MTWHKDVETLDSFGAKFVHQLLDDATHEVLAELDQRGNVLYADKRAVSMLDLALAS